MNSKEKREVAQALKSIFKFGTFFCLVFLFVAYWSNISWVFSFSEMNALLNSFFPDYQNNEGLAIGPILENSTIATEAVKTIEFPYSEKENILEIPSLDISAKINFPETNNASLLARALDRGVVYYPGSVLPGQNGQIVVLGHSAPLSWPKIANVGVFSRISELKDGDFIFLHIEHKKYTYSVIKNEIIDKGTAITPQVLTNSDNMLILVSCWPPGENLQRIAVSAKLVIN